jgi:ABC-type branched-subunit amino acid transport system ATPase component
METTAPPFQTERAGSVREHEPERSTLMHAEGLRKSFGGQTVLDGVSLDLQQGEVVLLRGANGSGKTTLLNILTGNLEPDAGHIQLFTNGEIEQFDFPRSWWQELNPFDRFLPERLAREGVGRTWQDIRLFSTQSLQDNIAVANPNQTGEHPMWALLRRFRVREEEREHGERAASQLAAMGLEGREASSADMVSLGQAKRVAILRAVEAGARVLFLDEPLGGLDAPGIEDVMGLLKRLAHEEDITLVIVEHVFNIPRVLELASTVWTLDEGNLTVESPEAARDDLTGGGNGVQNWIRNASGPNEVTSRNLPGGAVLSRFVPEGRAAGDVVLDVEDLVVRRGPRLVIGEESADGSVEGLSFTLRENEWGVLKAPNGWGKTTLLEVIAGTLLATSGTVRLEEDSLQDTPPWERDVSLLQARDHTFPTLSVREALRLAKVEEVPSYVEPLLDQRMSSLSGGEKQKSAMTIALKSKDTPLLCLLDEPFSALDTDAIGRITETVRQTQIDTFLFALPASVS